MGWSMVAVLYGPLAPPAGHVLSLQYWHHEITSPNSSKLARGDCTSFSD